jgi:thiamine pyrophosphokinase
MTSKTFEWRPAKLLQDYNIGQDFALLILNQPLKNGVNLRKLWKNSSVRVAADGGANRLHKLSSFHGKYSNLQLIIGDLDSLTPTVRDFYSSQPSPAQIIHDADQESTDFSKAVNWIRKEHSGIDIVALGGIGGRVDQGLSQLHHLYLFQTDPEYASGRVFLLSGSSLTFLLKSGTHQIQVREDGEEDAFGKHIGIIPLKEAANITTKGFEWDVEDWHTEIGGKLSTSNHILPESQVVTVTTDKDVLFTVALKEGDGDDE